MDKEVNDINELLKPRYKIVADWPTNQIGEVGKILELEKDRFDNWLYSYYLHDGKYSESDSTFDEYPHLFKKLAWWEERKESEMPAFVKSLINQKIYKVVNKNEVSFLAKSNIPGEMNIDYPWDNVLPATELSYNEQSNTKQP